MYIKKCRICGKEIITANSKKCLCSEMCKIENNRINARQRNERLRNEVKPQIKKLTLSELRKMAEEVNMSYGYYTGLNKL